MTAHAELIARLEAATGGDTGLDCDIVIACGLWRPPTNSERNPARVDGWRRGELNHYCPHTPLTASVDAALALVEQVLPGWNWSVGRDGTSPWARIDYDGTAGRYSGATPAIALCIAALTAIAASFPDQKEPMA